MPVGQGIVMLLDAVVVMKPIIIDVSVRRVNCHVVLEVSYRSIERVGA